MSATVTRVFCARLAGAHVFDPNGDAVGRVRDVVATLRVGGRPPRVLGLVVDVSGRRRIFVPILRVRAFTADGVLLNSGTVSLRRFERRAGETLVIEDLLDRRVTALESGQVVTVYDCGMEANRTGDWLLTRVAVRAGGRMGRRGQQAELRWDEVSGFALTEHGQGAEHLLATYENLRPADLASVLHDLSDKRRAEVAAALPDERLADVLEELPEDEQVEILETLDLERQADVLEAMSDDDAADLLRELSPADAARLLEVMEPDEAEPVRRLLVYGERTAGGLMTSEPVVLVPSATVAEALARIRNPELAPALAAQVFVCRPPTETPTGKLLGTCHFQRLLRESPGTLVGGIVDTDLAPLPPDASLRAVTQHLATYNLVAVPVTDHNGHLLGAVTVDDVLDHLLPENWREEEVGDAAG